MSPILNGYRSGPRMSLQMDGLDSSAAMLRDAAARGEDMRPAMRRVGLLFMAGNKEQFASHGSYLDTPWPPNSSETLARKAREGVPALGGLMVDSGDLEQSLAGGKGGFLRARRGSVSVGTSLFYAIFAMGGASGKGSNSAASRGARRGVEPARPIMGISEAERQASLGILTDYLLGRA
jgi:phage gpG-like protein